MLFPTKNRKKEATGKCRQHTVSLIFRWSQMNLCKQNYKLPHINKKQEICPSHIHSPELASGAFLKWVLIQKLGPQKNHGDGGRAVSMPWRAPNSQGLILYQKDPELSCWAEWPLLQGTQHTEIHEISISLEDGRFLHIGREDKTQKKKTEGK